MFVNYLRAGPRTTALNLAVARVVLGVYLAWKILSYDWGAVSDWPFPIYRDERIYWLFTSGPLNGHLELLAWILGGLCVLFIVGLWLRWVSFCMAALLIYLGGNLHTLDSVGGTEAIFIATYFVVLFGLYSEYDVLTLDRGRRRESPLALRNTLATAGAARYALPQLRWSIVVVAVLYFFSGMEKVVRGPVWEWARPETMARFLTHRREIYHTDPPLADLMLESELLLFGAEAGTIVLEVGMLVAIVAGIAVTPVMVGLFAMHAGIALTLNPFFLDSMIFLCLFLGWDRLLALGASEQRVDVVYDDTNSGLMQLLVVVSHLDVSDSLEFHPSSDPSWSVRGDLRVTIDGESYRGYEGVRCLLSACSRLTAPVATALGLPGVRSIGQAWYRRITAHDPLSASAHSVGD